MRNSLRMLALMLCVILLGTCVFASEPMTPRAGPGSRAYEASTALTEPEAMPTEPVTEPVTEPAPTEPVTEPTTPVTEPTEPVTEPTEPVVTTEPTEPVTEPTEPTDPTEPPEPPEPPVSEMTDEQIIAKYKIKNNWARQALIFAVRNQILTGKGDNNLAPTDNTTHAELATMLTSMLRADKQAAMDQFTDVKPSKWFYAPMSKAVALGIYPIADANATLLNPNVNVTREEAFVALARAFGVHSRERQAIYNFSDWKEVSDWAATDISALIEAGCIGGADGKIMPKAQITRQEYAQVLFRLVTRVLNEMTETELTGQFVLGAASVPDNTTVQGDLLLSNNAAVINLNGLTVTGKLILQGCDRLTLNLTNCDIQEIVACREVFIHSDTPLKTVTNHALLRLYCDAAAVNAYSNVILSQDCTVGTLTAYVRLSMTIVGTVDNLYILGDNVYINGSGLIKTLTQRGVNLANYCAVNNTVSDPYPTVSDVVAIRTDNGKATESAPVVTMQVKLTNMPEGWSEGDLVWFVNSVEVPGSRTTRNLLRENSVISQSYNFSAFMDGFHNEVLFTVYLTLYGKQVCVYRGYVNVDESVEQVAATIRTQNVQAKVNRVTGLYTNYSSSSDTYSGFIMNLQKGTQVTVLQVSESRAARVRLEDGRTGWMNSYHKDTIQVNYYITKDYSVAVKEYYVNNVRHWSSSTNYMIWVSLWTQRFNVFQKTGGKWKLIRSGQIASGTNYNPTPVEDVTLRYHVAQWTYNDFYVHHVTVFDSARGFHSLPTKYEADGGGIYDWTIGRPASHGCIRVLADDAIYIYGLPLGTAVHIY